MVATQTAMEKRRTLRSYLFPQGIPTLWCPPLTHYTADGDLDRDRMAAHLRSIAPYVKGLLVPGSTGDGWEMDDAEARQVLEFVLDLAPELGVQVLVGALRTDLEETHRAVADTRSWLRKRTGLSDDFASMSTARVCGFTVCPPKGQNRSQDQLRDALASVLELGVPTALYQLPQVTLNEMAPQTVADLAGQFSTFYLFKDSSGTDRVATSGVDLSGVIRVRGAEGAYDRWLRSSGGPYHGFLLSTANCFAPHLYRMIKHLDHGRMPEARAVSAPLSRVVAQVFELVADLPDGNAFANANKAVDHFMAHGPDAADLPPPRLHAGSVLPSQVIRVTGELLVHYNLMPSSGYLNP